jgi:hypothetical protein
MLHMGTITANQNCILEEVNNACYNSVPNPWSSDLLPTNINIRTYGNCNSTYIFVWVWNYSLASKEEQRLRVSEDRMLRKYFDLRGRKWQEIREKGMRTFVVCTLHQHCEGDKIKTSETNRTCSTHKRYQKCEKHLVGKPEGERPFKDLGIDGRKSGWIV